MILGNEVPTTQSEGIRLEWHLVRMLRMQQGDDTADVLSRHIVRGMLAWVTNHLLSDIIVICRLEMWDNCTNIMYLNCFV